MGCAYSPCQRQIQEKAEVEVEFSARDNVSIVKSSQKAKIQGNDLDIPALNILSEPSSQRLGTLYTHYQTVRTDSNEEPLKTAKSEPSTVNLTMALTFADRNSQGGSQKLAPNFNQMDFRSGKSPKDLYSDISQVKTYIIKALKLYQYSESLIKRTEAILEKWHEQVYDPVCKKTGEFKTSIVLNTNMSSVQLKHEISGCTVDQILLNFCRQNALVLNQDWVTTNLENLSETTSLVFSFGLEINFAVKDSVDCFVFLNSVRHFTTEFLGKILKDTCEEKNIIRWFVQNTPLLDDFGFTINTRFRTNEFNITLLIFDGTLRNNSTRAITAIQSHGAIFSELQLTILRKIPSEELRVVLYINEAGVTRVVMWMNRLTDEVAGEIIANFCKGDKNKEWEAMKTHLLEDDNTFRYFLEYSSEGYQFGYECRVGKDFGSFIYFESLV